MVPPRKQIRLLKWQMKISEFYNNRDITEEVRALIKKFPDTERALSRLIRLGPSPRDLYALKAGMNLFFLLKEKVKFLENNISLETNIECGLKDILNELELAIKEEPPLTIKEGGFIKENFNKELQKIKLVEKDGHH